MSDQVALIELLWLMINIVLLVPTVFLQSDLYEGGEDHMFIKTLFPWQFKASRNQNVNAAGKIILIGFITIFTIGLSFISLILIIVVALFGLIATCFMKLFGIRKEA